MIFVQLRKRHLLQRDDQAASRRLANKSITPPLCPQWQITYSWLQFILGAMPLGDKPKRRWPLRAVTMKGQMMIMRCSGKAASSKLVWNQHKTLGKSSPSRAFKLTRLPLSSRVLKLIPWGSCATSHRLAVNLWELYYLLIYLKQQCDSTFCFINIIFNSARLRLIQEIYFVMITGLLLCIRQHIPPALSIRYIW